MMSVINYPNIMRNTITLITLLLLVGMITTSCHTSSDNNEDSTLGEEAMAQCDVMATNAYIVDDDGDFTNIRNAPKGKVIDKIPTGQGRFRLWVDSYTNGWYHIKGSVVYDSEQKNERVLNGSDCWVHESIIRFEGTPDANWIYGYWSCDTVIEVDREEGTEERKCEVILFEDNTFVESCSGFSQFKGRYRIMGDTIHYISLGIMEKLFIDRKNKTLTSNQGYLLKKDNAKKQVETYYYQDIIDDRDPSNHKVTESSHQCTDQNPYTNSKRNDINDMSWLYGSWRLETGGFIFWVKITENKLTWEALSYPGIKDVLWNGSYKLYMNRIEINGSTVFKVDLYKRRIYSLKGEAFQKRN